MTNRIEIKQGEALLMQWLFQNDDGSAADLSNVTLRSHVRTVTGDLVTSLPIVRTATQGIATVTVADTTMFPVGELRCDILAVVNGLNDLSETFGIRVGRAVTQ